ncbi:hypothetical protein F3K43_13460 [Streptomyces sp. LBUM 1476]|nr:hypothetical protein [Streptomyces sp. LBUM 1476]
MGLGLRRLRVGPCCCGLCSELRGRLGLRGFCCGGLWGSGCAAGSRECAFRPGGGGGWGCSRGGGWGFGSGGAAGCCGSGCGWFGGGGS